MSRKEARLARDMQKKSNAKMMAIVGGSVVLIVAIVAIVLSLTLNKGGTDDKITAIEKHAPADIDALFVSKPNALSIEYMETLAGSKFGQQINASNQIGVGFKKGKSFFYVSGEKKAMDAEMKSRGLDKLPNLDGVYVLEGGEEGLVEIGLGSDEGYQGREGMEEDPMSFGYVTNTHAPDFFKGDSGIPQEKWEWHGNFDVNGAWVGKITNITSKDFNLTKFKDWVQFEKKDKWVSDMFVKEGDKIGFTISRDSLALLRGVESYSSGIDDIKGTLDAEGTMEFSFGKK